MSDLHNIQKSLADRLNAEYEDTGPVNSEAENDQVVVGLAERAQEKMEAEAKALEEAKVSETASKKKTFQPIGIALVMFAFVAVIITGEIIL